LGWTGGSNTFGFETRYTTSLSSGDLTAGLGIYRDQLRVDADFDDEDVDYMQLTRLFQMASHNAIIDESQGRFTGFRTPLLFSYDHRFSENKVMSIVTRVNIRNLTQHEGHWLIARPTWTHAPSESVRYSLGMWFFLPYLVPRFDEEEIEDDMDRLLDEAGLSRRVNLPMPYIALWWVI